MLEVIRRCRAPILTAWHELYVRHFGAARGLDNASFKLIYEPDVDALVGNLIDEDLDGFVADERAVGYALAERNVPFEEVVASLHLFEESVVAELERNLGAFNGHLYLLFDKLSHCRVIVLAGAYFGEREAGERVLRRTGPAPEVGPIKRESFHQLVGGTANMRRLYREVAAAAAGTGSVLICGESGVGKEVVARTLHECSGDPERPFVAVNCAAIPRELIESELFGHSKGAYTGAVEYVGLVRSASGGTLFLDEITEMAAEVQAKLLRVLEERAVRPVGAAREIQVDVRFVASSNREPEAAIEIGKLRRDLFYRLNTHRIVIPPLRTRSDDIEALCTHFAELLATRGLRRVGGIDPDALEVMRGYAWPGNVRELRNVVEHALAAGRGSSIARGDLPSYLTGATAPRRAIQASIPPLEDAERELIMKALSATGGNKVQTAKLLRISRHRLYDRMRKYGLLTPSSERLKLPPSDRLKTMPPSGTHPEELRS
jgi:DNA-binding NtrC family response regulator